MKIARPDRNDIKNVFKIAGVLDGLTDDWPNIGDTELDYDDYDDLKKLAEAVCNLRDLLPSLYRTSMLSSAIIDNNIIDPNFDYCELHPALSFNQTAPDSDL